VFLDLSIVPYFEVAQRFGNFVVPETFCCLEYQTMAKVQKFSNLECYTPSSEPLRIDFVSFAVIVKSIHLLSSFPRRTLLK
jgi:hypothetical protein